MQPCNDAPAVCCASAKATAYADNKYKCVCDEDVMRRTSCTYQIQLKISVVQSDGGSAHLAAYRELDAVPVVVSQPGLAEEDVQQACTFVRDLDPVRVPPVTWEGGPEP